MASCSFSYKKMHCLCYVVVAVMVIKCFLWRLHLRLSSWPFFLSKCKIKALGF
jgi:hypothetical protein